MPGCIIIEVAPLGVVQVVVTMGSAPVVVAEHDDSHVRSMLVVMVPVVVTDTRS